MLPAKYRLFGYSNPSQPVLCDDISVSDFVFFYRYSDGGWSPLRPACFLSLFATASYFCFLCSLLRFDVKIGASILQIYLWFVLLFLFRYCRALPPKFSPFIWFLFMCLMGFGGRRWRKTRFARLNGGLTSALKILKVVWAGTFPDFIDLFFFVLCKQCFLSNFSLFNKIRLWGGLLRWWDLSVLKADPCFMSLGNSISSWAVTWATLYPTYLIPLAISFFVFCFLFWGVYLI